MLPKRLGSLKDKILAKAEATKKVEEVASVEKKLKKKL